MELRWSPIAMVVSLWLFQFIFVTGQEKSIPSSAPLPKVKTPQGELEGIFLNTRRGRSYAAFLGIPYAKFPGRFRVASEFAQWEGILQAKKFGAMCAQVDLFLEAPFKGEEDCLFINVYTPNLNAEAEDDTGLLPVYFYIHGGGLMSGSGNYYSGKYFLDEEIVLVNFNYRLGPLGFFTFNTGTSFDIPGNLGLKDQHLALRWVHNNIQYFGGDPTKVTIGGFSSGASSVHYHVLSSRSEGLFRAAIARGGSAISFWATQRNPRENAQKFANIVGCPALNETNCNIVDVVQCFRDRPVQQLTELQLKLREWHNFPLMPFSVVVEPDMGNDTFITSTPRRILEEGRFFPVPLLLGINREEVNLMAYSVVAKKNRLEDLSQYWNIVAPILFDYRHLSRQDKRQLNKALRLMYTPEWETHDGISNDSVIKLMRDRFFLEPLDTSVRLHSQFGPVYPFILCHRPQFSLMNALFKIPGFHGIVHGDGLQYLFPKGTAGAPDYSIGSPYPDEVEFSQKFVSLLGGFIRDLKPTLWNDYVWEPVGKNQSVKYLELDNQLVTYQEPDRIFRLEAYRKLLQEADN